MREPDRSRPSIQEQAWDWAATAPEMAAVAARIMALKARERRLCPLPEATEHLAQMGITLRPPQIRMIYQRGKIYTEKELRFKSGQMRWMRLVDPKELAYYISLPWAGRRDKKPWMDKGYLEGYEWKTTTAITRDFATILV